MRPTKKKGSKAVAKPLPIEVNLAEFTELLRHTLKQHHRIAFLLAWGSGLRISEVIHVQPGDINWEEMSIRVNMGKNSKDRIVPIPKGFEKVHMKYIPIKCKQRSLQKAFITYARKSGMLDKKPKAHFHSLRHGFATHSLRCGMTLIDIQGHLGHEDVSTTSIYTNLAPKERLQNYQDKFGVIAQ